jgi:hypothetical protein
MVLPRKLPCDRVKLIWRPGLKRLQLQEEAAGHSRPKAQPIGEVKRAFKGHARSRLRRRLRAQLFDLLEKKVLGITGTGRKE